jgi:hypothetical protein
MRTRQRATIENLRLTIDCLPRDTKIAMLDGIRANEIVVGAYSHSGGICPMLAAHRAGGRTNFIAFSRAWDRFAFRDARRRQARRATERELLVLTSNLEASLLADDGPAPELREAIAQHRELTTSRGRQAEGKERVRRPGDPDRSRELKKRHGWSWMRVVRRYDEYERALELLESAPREEQPAEREPQLAERERQHAEPAAR